MRLSRHHHGLPSVGQGASPGPLYGGGSAGGYQAPRRPARLVLGWAGAGRRRGWAGALCPRVATRPRSSTCVSGRVGLARARAFGGMAAWKACLQRARAPCSQGRRAPGLAVGTHTRGEVGRAQAVGELDGLGSRGQRTWGWRGGLAVGRVGLARAGLRSGGLGRRGQDGRVDLGLDGWAGLARLLVAVPGRPPGWPRGRWPTAARVTVVLGSLGVVLVS